MLYTGLFKRILPFVLTFAAGLFVASFFVSIALPSLSSWREARRDRRCGHHREMRAEIEQLNEMIRVLARENENLKNDRIDADPMLNEAVPPVEWNAPKPPPPPRKPRHPHFDSVQ